MPSTRPRHPYRTARERVALRRAGGSMRARSKQRSGCGSILIGAFFILILAGIFFSFVTRRATEMLEAFEQSDPRQAVADSNSDNAPGEEVAATPQIKTLREPFNVLLVGVDERDDPDEGVRSDTLIVVHVDPVERWAGMLSIPRDSVVQIPRLGQQKINAAYTYGYANADMLYGSGTAPAAAGGALAAETVENFLGLEIDYISQVDFHGFEMIVDTLGGITVDVPHPLLDPEYPTEDFGYERIYIPAGLQVLDGQTALRYARSRHSDSDFDRSRRQQQVLKAMLRDVRQRGLLDQATLLPELVNDLEQTVATTLPLSDPAVLRDLVNLAQMLTPERIVQLSINPDDVRIVTEAGSDIYWDQRDVEAQVDRLLAGPQTDDKVARVQVQNGAGVRGLATRVTTNLESQGFLMAEAVDAPGLYEHTLIIDYTDHPETRQRLAQLLGVESDYVQAEPAADTPPAPYQTDIVIVLGQDYQERWAGGR
ncbi:MAG: LCP family protein [Chloroflexaceae bacterium]